MKALAFRQPWASAIVMGLKKIDTRSWTTSYRGPLAIYAAKGWGRYEQDLADTMGMPLLPFGKVIAVVDLFDVHPTDLLGLFVSDQERAWGDYSPGRYGLMMTNVRKLFRPLEVRGYQRFFDVPDADIEAAL